MTPSPAAVPPRASRTLRWVLIIGAAVVAAIGMVLMFLLTLATNNRVLYEQNYERLFMLNVAVAGVLVAVIAWIAWRLLARLRKGKFGSRLLVKLAAIFALVGILPGLLIYTVSYQFVSRSIESWFNVRVEGALDAGVSLGRSTLDALAADLGAKSRAAGVQLSDTPDALAALTLERLREQLSAQDVILYNGAGQLIASAGDSRFAISPERPGAQQLRLLRSQRVMTQIEGLDDATAAAPNARVRALVLVPSAGVGLLAEPRYLQVTQALPPALVANALAVQEANREYQQRALARDGLRRMYIGTLTLSLFLSVFGAVLLAVLLGNQLARPLLLLADGVRQVARGDLTPTAALQTRDELGGLTRSFADMTRQLAEARDAADKSMGEVNTTRANLQTILDNLTAGVIVLDEAGAIVSANPSATRILRAPFATRTGQPLAGVPGLEGFGRDVQSQFDAFARGHDLHGLDHWQRSFELDAAQPGAPENTLTLVARGAPLPGGARLLVFDDISEIVSAQRAQAWGEVARRLAHEIKNPLTPIQLSAERLQHKLAERLEGPERALLAKSVKTIVDQVDAMKRLVNEFRDYARLPAAVLQPVHLNALIHDVLQLYAEEHASGQLVIELDAACPPIRGDAQQLRQVLHNLVQNAIDATEGAARREVQVITRWSEANQRVRLLVRDSGPGFAAHILKRAFEPYVTTKARGTGLGLAVVKKIADEHAARIDLSNREADGTVLGAQVSLSFETAAQDRRAAEVQGQQSEHGEHTGG